MWRKNWDRSWEKILKFGSVLRLIWIPAKSYSRFWLIDLPFCMRIWSNVFVCGLNAVFFFICRVRCQEFLANYYIMVAEGTDEHEVLRRSQAFLLFTPVSPKEQRLWISKAFWFYYGEQTVHTFCAFLDRCWLRPGVCWMQRIPAHASSFFFWGILHNLETNMKFSLIPATTLILFYLFTCTCVAEEEHYITKLFQFPL